MQSPLQTSVQELRITRDFEGICAWTGNPIRLHLKPCTRALVRRQLQSSLTCVTMLSSLYPRCFWLVPFAIRRNGLQNGCRLTERSSPVAQTEPDPGKRRLPHCV